jgi:16S rRNA (uracil1498-N3)-methyltransferase
MPYFFSPRPLQMGAELILEGEDASHLLKSRRMRAGETFAVQDPSGARFLAQLTRSPREGAWMRVLAPVAPPPLPGRRLTLLLAAAKDKAVETALQKAAELGVAEICLVATRFSALTQRELAAPRSRARWERILREACKQCDRQFPPPLRIEAGLAAALNGCSGAVLRVALHPDARESLAAALAGAAPDSAAVLVGPEGGLASEESSLAAEAGFRPVSLGRLVLRAETAAIAACAVLLFSGGPSP